MWHKDCSNRAEEEVIMYHQNLKNLTIVFILFLFFGLSCSISSPRTQSDNPNSQTPQPPPMQSPTPEDENAKLREKLEELEKKMEEKQKTPPPIKPTVPIIKNSGTYARVSSPGDGFLAMRSDPSSEVGYRILQIPHGSIVRILGCQGFTQRVGGRNGRWCRVSYEGYIGWAFDGWLVY